MVVSRFRRRILSPTQRDRMIAALGQCRATACATMSETKIQSELYRRLDRLTEAIDDVVELQEMAGDREHLWRKAGGR